MYAREFNGQPYEFGVIGVDKGTLILYDAQTRSRWSQLTGQAISGAMAGMALQKLPKTMTTWRAWRARHPETTVYVKHSIPYRPRFTAERFEALARAEPGPVRSDDLIIGLEGHVQARAYLVRCLARNRCRNDVFEAEPILVYLAPDSATARVFKRTLGTRTLRFRLLQGERLQDAETESLWDPVTGACVSGPLQGETLAPLVGTPALWFAWHKYRPDTEVVEEPDSQ